ncbi:MAG: hypothetical protein Q8P67_13785 [archaeon]|nr:hypothetical protein [archaeon]
MSSSYSYSRMMTLARSLPKSEVTPLLANGTPSRALPSSKRPSSPAINHASSRQMGAPLYVVDPAPSSHSPYASYLKGMQPGYSNSEPESSSCCGTGCCMPQSNKLDLWCGRQSNRTRSFLLIAAILMCTFFVAIIAFTPSQIIYSKWDTQVCFSSSNFFIHFFFYPPQINNPQFFKKKDT